MFGGRNLNIKQLKVNQLVNPIGIDKQPVRLTWELENCLLQTAVEIRTRLNGGEWATSGKVESKETFYVLDEEFVSRSRVDWQVRIWNEEDEVSDWSDVASFEIGLLNKGDWKAEWIEPEEDIDSSEHQPASVVRKTFTVSNTNNARLYITALGLYEAKLNGHRVGEFVLAPGTSTYEKRVHYQTYDISTLLIKGENTLEVTMGDGWFRSVSGVDGIRNLFGERIALIAQIEVDGHPICVTNDSWEASQSGPIRYNDMQQGEVVDLQIDSIKDWHPIRVASQSKEILYCSNAPIVKEHENFKGRLFQNPNGQWIVDFGQNIAGFVEVSFEGQAGSTVTLTHGETLDAEGNFTNENFQDRSRHKEGGTHQSLTIYAKEGLNHYKTRFSIFGFRYALVETDLDMTNATFTAIAVYSDFPVIGTFESGNEKLNQFVQNTLWSLKSNFVDVPTDCPTRERAAWTGDIGVFVDTALNFTDSVAFLEKWLEECRLNQHEDGKIANIAPRINEPNMFSTMLAGSVGWGDAVVLIPYAIYKRTRDTKVLQENYPMMKKWVNYLESRAKVRPDNLSEDEVSTFEDYTIDTGVDYGEWCEPGVNNLMNMRTPQTKVSTAYFAYSSRLLSEIAGILDEKEDADYFRNVAENARQAFHSCATVGGEIFSERQADYVRALHFNLLNPEESKTAAAKLNELVVNAGYHLNTGFLSTPNICRVLSEYGYADTAYRLLLQGTAPSWLYSVNKGATTVWETWDGIDENGNVKESLNHYSYGAICAWLWDGVAGIQLSTEGICIAPIPSPTLGYAKASVHTSVGKISSAWEVVKDRIHYTVTIPANQLAFVSFPGGHEYHLTEGTHTFNFEYLY